MQPFPALQSMIDRRIKLNIRVVAGLSLQVINLGSISGEENFVANLSIAKASSQAFPEDVIYIQEGVYEETLLPVRSGNPGNPITQICNRK